MRYRLLEYWMTEHEVTELIRHTVDFAEQTAAAHPQPDSSSADVIPIAVGLKVCTVQQQGETISAARDRAMRGEHLVPLYLWPFTPESWRIAPDLRYFLMKRRTRVEKSDEGLGLMKMCSICSRGPWIGAVITRLLWTRFSLKLRCSLVGARQSLPLLLSSSPSPTATAQ